MMEGAATATYRSSKGVVHAAESTTTFDTQAQVMRHSDVRLRSEQQQEMHVVHHGPTGTASVSHQSASSSSSFVTHQGVLGTQIQPTGKGKEPTGKPALPGIQPTGKGTEPTGKPAVPGIAVDTSWQRGKLEHVKLCSFLLRSKCDRGPQCGFAHSLDDLTKPQWATVESGWPGWPDGKTPLTSVCRLYVKRHLEYNRPIPPEIERLVEYPPEVRNADREVWLRDPRQLRPAGGAVRPPGYKAPP